MAIGFPPKYKKQINTIDINYAVAYISASYAAERLGWKIEGYTENGFYANTRLSMKSAGERVVININYSNIIVTSSCQGMQLTDSGNNKFNVERFIECFNILVTELSETIAEQRFIELKDSFGTTGSDILKRENSIRETSKSTKGKIRFIPESPAAAIIPTSNYYITPLLAFLNTAIFFIMVMAGVGFIMPETESLVEWGGNFPPDTINGDWWRLFTACFLHAGVLHLLMNMIVFIYIGVLLEPFIGSIKFLMVYILSGIFASITSVVWNTGMAVGVGASGAIFGMYGFFIALLVFKYFDSKDRKGILISILIFAGYNVMNGLVDEGVDNAAHIGGLIGGFIIGCINYIDKSRLFKKHHLEIISGLSAIFVTLYAVIIISVFVNKNDIELYYKIDKLIEIEEKANNSVSVINEFTSYDLTILSYNKGIEHWDKGIEMLDSIDIGEASDYLKERRKKMLRYAKLRRKSFELSKRAVELDTDKYDDEIDDCITEADKLVDEL